MYGRASLTCGDASPESRRPGISPRSSAVVLGSSREDHHARSWARNPQPGTRRRAARGDAAGRAERQAGRAPARLVTELGVAAACGATELDVAAFLDVCRIKGPDRDRLLALCQEQHTPGWFQQHGSRLPKQLMTLIDHENKAVAIGDFQSVIVPGLLQTGEYARAVISRVVKRATRRGGRSGGRPAGPAEPVQPGPHRPGSASTCTSPYCVPRWAGAR